MANKLDFDKPIKIREAEIKAPEIIAILCEQLGYSLARLQIEQCLTQIKNDDSQILYVATLANDYVIGLVQAYIRDLILCPTLAFVHCLVVDKDYRHHGFGRLLMQHIEQWASLAGYDGTLLRSDIKRQEAHLFYKKIGYTNTKQQKTFYKALSNQ